MTRGKLLCMATLALGACTVGDNAPGPADGFADPAMACEAMACDDVTDCEQMDDGIACACVHYDDPTRNAWCHLDSSSGDACAYRPTPPTPYPIATHLRSCAIFGCGMLDPLECSDDARKRCACTPDCGEHVYQCSAEDLPW